MQLTRRDFVKLIVAVSGLSALASLVPSGGFLSYGSNPKIERKKIGNIAELKPYSAIIFQWPTESHPYHTNLLIRGREGAGMGRHSNLYAFNRVCTHLQCIVNYDPTINQIVCPCHGSAYNATDGTNISGPAPRALPTIKLDEDENGNIYAYDIVGVIGYGR